MKTLTSALSEAELGKMFEENSLKASFLDSSAFITHDVIDKPTFLRLVSEITSKIRQQVGTEINLPTDECVKDWFSGCANENDLFWTHAEMNNKQVLAEIIKALKYFIVTWQPVRNQKFATEQTKKSCGRVKEYQDWLGESDICVKFNEWVKRAENIDSNTVDLINTEFWNLLNEKPVKQSEIPEDRLREELKWYTDTIRDYERESGHSIHDDERESIEFVNDYLGPERKDQNEKDK